MRPCAQSGVSASLVFPFCLVFIFTVASAESLRHAALVLGDAPPPDWTAVAPCHLLRAPAPKLAMPWPDTHPGSDPAHGGPTLHRVVRLAMPTTMSDADADRALRTILLAVDATERSNVTGLHLQTHRWQVVSSASSAPASKVTRKSSMRAPTPSAAGRFQRRQQLGAQCDVVSESASHCGTRHWTFACPQRHQSTSSLHLVALVLVFSVAHYGLPSGWDAATVWLRPLQRSCEEAGLLLLSASQVTPAAVGPAASDGSDAGYSPVRSRC